jgi:DNA-binding IclR family transcriptional regulator
MIKKRLEEIRDSGHIWIHEEFAEGISSVAAPVFDQARRALGAIHVHGPTYRFPGDIDPDATAGLVMDAAERVSARAHSYTRDQTNPARPADAGRPSNSRRNGNPRRNGK